MNKREFLAQEDIEKKKILDFVNNEMEFLN